MKKLQYNILFLSLISFSATMSSQSESKTWYASNYTIPLVAAGSFFLGTFATSVFKYFRGKDSNQLKHERQRAFMLNLLSAFYSDRSSLRITTSDDSAKKLADELLEVFNLQDTFESSMSGTGPKTVFFYSKIKKDN